MPKIEKMLKLRKFALEEQCKNKENSHLWLYYIQIFVEEQYNDLRKFDFLSDLLLGIPIV